MPHGPMVQVSCGPESMECRAAHKKVLCDLKCAARPSPCAVRLSPSVVRPSQCVVRPNPKCRAAQPECRAAQPKCRAAQPKCRVVHLECRAAQLKCRAAQHECRAVHPKCRTVLGHGQQGLTGCVVCFCGLLVQYLSVVRVCVFSRVSVTFLKVFHP